MARVKKLEGSAQKKPEMPNYLKFVFGGLAGCCAQTCIQPLDLIKNRMQMSGVGGAKKEYKNTLHAFQTIVAKEGVSGLYTGLSAAIVRQITYGTTRLGVFQTLMDLAKGPNNEPPNFAVKTLIGMFAGVCGATVGTPAEVCLIRMTLDGRLPVNERRNYKNVVDAMLRIAKEEGPATLMKGAIPTISRAVVVNAAQLGTYSQSKEMLLKSGYVNDNIFCHIWASMISGFCTSVASLPVDIVKTRVQNKKATAGEKTSSIKVATEILQKEGIGAFWKGLTPYYARLGPITVLIFVFLEQFNAAYYRYAEKKQ